ncbi:iron-sulfur cluster biosynthesis family protein [Galbitalea sp. SE-J8]|uniref:HesB/IscA family protein n=1 Tax=Galbitalea sp. SE-J8 TaxID=3054952 RepID=UPI00259CB171|nr:iron-sulfur cluster biosynthesis family protein [Galbitalea sp. SE-J8]MDM4761991.1 iron-sulfur cluster biosynthesis family protein [Galbitalea sp. SE-J8]
MLTLTENAATVVKTIADQAPEADQVGLRIAADATDAAELTLAVVTEPQPDDQVVESAGARVFLEPNAALLLDDKVLDADVAENGSVTFAVANA